MHPVHTCTAGAAAAGRCDAGVVPPLRHDHSARGRATRPLVPRRRVASQAARRLRLRRGTLVRLGLPRRVHPVTIQQVLVVVAVVVVSPSLVSNKIAQSNLGTGRVASPKHTAPLARCGPPSNTPMHGADPTHHHKPQLRRFMHFHTAAPQTPHWLQWGDPHSPPKLPPPVNRFPNPTICLIPGPIRPTIPDHIYIRSAVLP